MPVRVLTKICMMSALKAAREEQCGPLMMLLWMINSHYSSLLKAIELDSAKEARTHCLNQILALSAPPSCPHTPPLVPYMLPPRRWWLVKTQKPKVKIV